MAELPETKKTQSEDGRSKKTQKATLRSRLSVWVFSLAAVIIVPILPLGVEARKNHGQIKPEDYLLTAAVLAAGYGFSSEGYFARAAYLVLFLFSIVYDFGPDDSSGPTSKLSASLPTVVHGSTDGLIQELGSDAWIWVFSHPAFGAVLAVAMIHAIERFTWHVVLDRRFPDWVKEA